MSPKQSNSRPSSSLQCTSSAGLKVRRNQQTYKVRHLNTDQQTEEQAQQESSTLHEQFQNLCAKRKMAYVPAIVPRPQPPRMQTSQDLTAEPSKAERKLERSASHRGRLKRQESRMEKSGAESRGALHQLTVKRVSISMSSRSFTRSISFLTQEDKPTAATSTSPSTSAEVTQYQGVTSARSSIRTPDLSARQAEDIKIMTTVPPEEAAAAVDQPTTYTTKGRLEYFTPCIQVTQEEADDDRTVTEMYIRGWKVDKAMMEVFLECWPTLPLLHTVHLWNTGLAADTLPLLASFLPLCRHLHTLVLDGNALTGTPVSTLFGEGSLLKHLSLRFCGITDTEAYAIGSALAVTTCRVSLLLTLNLSNNQIGDVGAGHIADGLKLNRSLLTLNLASNQIGDEGVAKLSIALSQFPLSHKQIVERRQLLSKEREKENASPNLSARTGRSREARFPKSPLASSSSNTKGTTERGKTSKPHDSKEKKKPKSRPSSARIRRSFGQEAKDSGKTDALEESISMTALSNLLKSTKQKPSKKSQARGPQKYSLEHPANPLIGVGNLRDGELWLEGNRTLISLNLSRNRIGARGFRLLLEAVEYQTQPFHTTRQESSGLKRLVVHRNAAPDDDQSLRKLNKHMQLRDPFFRTPNMDLSKPNITPCSIPVIF